MRINRRLFLSGSMGLAAGVLTGVEWSFAADRDRALFEACRRGDVDAARRLLDRGASPRVFFDVKYPLYQETCLHAAVEAGSLSLVALLLERGALPNLKPMSDYVTSSPLLFADDLEILRLLLKKGADVNLWRDEWSPALGFTSAFHIDHLQLLIDFGLDFESRTTFGEPLIMTVIDWNPDPEAVRTLLESGASLGYENEEAWRTAHRVCANSSTFENGYTREHHAKAVQTLRYVEMEMLRRGYPYGKLCSLYRRPFTPRWGHCLNYSSLRRRYYV